MLTNTSYGLREGASRQLLCHALLDLSAGVPLSFAEFRWRTTESYFLVIRSACSIRLSTMNRVPCIYEGGPSVILNNRHSFELRGSMFVLYPLALLMVPAVSAQSTGTDNGTQVFDVRPLDWPRSCIELIVVP